MSEIKQLEELFNSFRFGEFKPCFIYNKTLNFIEYLEEDCCTVTDHASNSNIELLRKWDGEKYCGIVGMRIHISTEIAKDLCLELKE